jgi:condensation enzyme
VNLADSAQTDSALADQIPLSLNQEFVCLFDHGDDDGPFGPRYHIVQGWRIRGKVSVDALRRALRDLVVRHEALRTLIVRGEDGKYQEILPPSDPELSLRDFSASDGASRDQQAERLIREIEAETIGAEQVPLLKAVLARFDDDDAVLALMVHHLATDGWSMRVTIRDLANRYAAQRGYDVPELPQAPQYRAYSTWQREASDAEVTARAYWRKRLEGARITAIPTDIGRSAGLPQSTAVHRFLIPASVIASVSRLANTARSSPFMIMLAAYMLVLQRMTGDTDVVVPTFTPGRGGSMFQDSVGSFFNFVPLRTDLAGCKTFREVLERTRKTCLEAYTHDIPTISIFAEAPELMLPAIADRAAPAVFQIFPDPVMLGDDIAGDLKYTEITRRLISQPVGSAIPDGALWTLNMEPSGEVVGNTSFKRNLFHESTISDMVAEFHQVLASVVAAPDSLLSLA